MVRRGMEAAARGRNPSREAKQVRQTQSVGGSRQAWPIAIVANSPGATTAAVREGNDHLQRRLTQQQGVVDDCREKAKEAENNLKLLTDKIAELRLASEAQAITLEEKEKALTLAQSLNGGMKRAVAGLRKEIAESTSWANEPTRGAEALAHLLSGGNAEGPPTYVGFRGRWSPGILREIFVWKKSGACACMRDFAATALSRPHQRFVNTVILGQGGFGVVRRGTCKKTNKVYAVKTIKPGCAADGLVQELLGYSIIDEHKNIVSIYALSDVAGSEGIIMEVAVCDLFAATTGKSDPVFALDQILSFEADAAEGLSYIHGKGIVHCDVKLDNTLVCRSNGPAGYVGKITDLGLWCGLGERRGAKMGAMGRVPVENIIGDVLAAPNQDAFAAGCDACFLVIHPDMKTGDANLWTHWSLTTEQEQQRLIALHAQGGDVNSIRADITLRTMSDGSLSRFLLQPEKLNPALPASELVSVCHVLRRMVSRDPTERLSMTTFTAFLRRLAAKTAAALATPLPEIGIPPTIQHPSGIGSGVGHPPVVDLPPPEVPVIVDGGEDGEDSIPPADRIRGERISAPAPVLAPSAEVGSNDTADAVSLANDIEANSGLVPRDSTPPAAAVEPPNATFAALPPVVAPHAEVNPANAVVDVLPAESLAAGNGSTLPSADLPAEAGAANSVMAPEEEVAPAIASMERVHLPPPVVTPHAVRDGHGVAPAAPPAEAIEAGNGSAMRGPAPPVVDPPAEAEAAEVADISPEEITRRVSPFFSPFPRSPAEVMACYVASTLRTRRDLLGMENAPLDVAGTPLAGQTCRRGGGGDSGGGDELRGGRAQEEGGRWTGWLAGLTRQ